MTEVFTDEQKQTIRLIRGKLLPLLVICMFVCFLDRINVGFAALTMNKALNLSAAAYGLGAGLFFVGYFIFEVPSNLIMEKVGPRIWITRIMLTWGVIAALMAFVQGAKSFYAMRLLLGLAEAGFFPGIVLYITYWFPKRERALATGTFLIGSYLGGALGSPISGLILSYFNGAAGLAGWQWLFVLEGIPAVILGFIVWRYLPDRPQQVKWLSQEQKNWLVSTIENENKEIQEAKHISLWTALTRPKTLLLCLIYLCFATGNLGLTLWMPQIIKLMGQGLSNLSVTLLNMLPFWFCILALVVWSRHSDKTGERKWHVSSATFVAAIGLAVAAAAPNLTVGMIGLILAGLGFGGGQPTFWATATQTLDPREAAAAIALINSVGNLGGFFGPNIMGIASSITSHYNAGVYCFAISFVLAVLLLQLLFLINKKTT
jgi:ACS family tartrate transporter-like MFS transporter